MVNDEYYANSKNERKQMEDSYGDRRYDIYGRRNPVQETGTIQNCIVMQEMAAAKQRAIYSKTDSENYVGIKLPQRSTDNIEIVKINPIKLPQRSTDNIERVKSDLKTDGIELVEIILKEAHY
jgi:hypothetical protein